MRYHSLGRLGEQKHSSYRPPQTQLQSLEATLFTTEKITAASIEESDLSRSKKKHERSSSISGSSPQSRQQSFPQH
jgi:hypothetical protein